MGSHENLLFLDTRFTNQESQSQTQRGQRKAQCSIRTVHSKITFFITSLSGIRGLSVQQRRYIISALIFLMACAIFCGTIMRGHFLPSIIFSVLSPVTLSTVTSLHLSPRKKIYSVCAGWKWLPLTTPGLRLTR